MTVHELKTFPAYFEAMWEARKTFDVRYDDRGYQAGDQLELKEFAHGVGYTGRVLRAVVGYVLASTPSRGNRPGFNGRGYVVLALVEVTHHVLAVIDGQHTAAGLSEDTHPTTVSQFSAVSHVALAPCTSPAGLAARIHEAGR